MSYAAARWWPFGAAAIVIAVAAGVAVANQRDELLQADVGDVVQTSVNATSLDNEEIRLPIGVVQAGVTAPLIGAPQLRGRDAPEDGSWVGITVAATVDGRLPQPTDVPQGGRPQPPVVVELIAGGRTYPVPTDSVNSPPRTSPALARQAWVAVAGRSKDVRIAITYDGVRQSVRPSDGKRTAGRAAPLYDLTLEQTTFSDAPSCGTVRFPSSYGRVSANFAPICKARRYPSVPYLPQLGWAPGTSRWLAFEIRLEDYLNVSWQGAGGKGVTYNIHQVPAVKVSLDGIVAVMGRAKAPTIARAGGLDPTFLAIFAVSATATGDRLTVSAQWRDLDTSSGPPPAGAPVAPDIALSWSKDVR